MDDIVAKGDALVQDAAEEYAREWCRIRNYVYESHEYDNENLELTIHARLRGSINHCIITGIINGIDVTTNSILRYMHGEGEF